MISLLTGRIKLIAGAVAVTIFVSMAGSIYYLQKSNESKSATISELNQSIDSLVSEKKRLQLKLKDQEYTHLSYRENLDEYKSRVSDLKRSIMKLKEGKSEEPVKTINSIHLGNINCLSDLSKGAIGSSSCSPSKANPSTGD